MVVVVTADKLQQLKDTLHLRGSNVGWIKQMLLQSAGGKVPLDKRKQALSLLVSWTPMHVRSRTDTMGQEHSSNCK